MSEEQIVLGRPPRPPRRGRRVGHAALVAAVVAGAGWAAWRGVLDQPATTPGDTAHTNAPAPSGTGGGLIAHGQPEVPYLRSSTLVRTGQPPRGLPDGWWTDFAELTDGRVVLVEQGGVTVVGPGRERTSHDAAGPISARPDGSAIAWTGEDGRVRQLETGRAEPAVVPDARQPSPACRGLRVGGRVERGWGTCDRDGALVSPDGHYFASIGSGSVTLAPRTDITGGISVAFLGVVRDAVWEDAYHLLVVTAAADEAHLIRIGLGGESEELIAPVRTADDRDRPVLVLPATAGRAVVQP
jgi:hypothetical protein